MVVLKNAFSWRRRNCSRSEVSPLTFVNSSTLSSVDLTHKNKLQYVSMGDFFFYYYYFNNNKLEISVSMLRSFTFKSIENFI